MEYFSIFFAFGVGFLLAWYLKGREGKAKEALLKERLQIVEEKLKLQKDLPAKMAANFRQLAAEALQENTATFVELTKELFEGREKAFLRLSKPLEEHLNALREEIKKLEKERQTTYGRLEEKLRALVEEHLPRLEKEARQLQKILEVPQSRGKWGEIQLKRLVEMAGLLKYCDFHPQKAFKGALRPDLVVHLPGERFLVVDAKAPLPEERNSYVKALKRHIDSLAQKAYWKALREIFARTPDFVILFLPAESLLSLAYHEDRSILEYAVKRKVILATPLTLLSILKAVALSWQEAAFMQNAEEIIKSGQNLYQRLVVFSAHLKNLARSLEQTVKYFNQLSSSFQKRLLPVARRFEELGVVSPDEKLKTSEKLKLDDFCQKDLDL